MEKTVFCILRKKSGYKVDPWTPIAVRHIKKINRLCRGRKSMVSLKKVFSNLSNFVHLKYQAKKSITGTFSRVRDVVWEIFSTILTVPWFAVINTRGTAVISPAVIKHTHK